MTDTASPSTPVWPFVVTDLALCAAAGYVLFQNLPATTTGQYGVVAACLLVGAFAAYLGLLPWLLNHRAAMKQLEFQGLLDASVRFGNLESISEQIQGAAGNIHALQGQSSELLNVARESAERTLQQAKELSESLAKGNEQEKNTLRLELEKLRKGEIESLQVIVRMLDHTYALYNAALSSGQANVVGQLEKFQTACRDTARRVGISVFEIRAGESFNNKAHQLFSPGQTEPADPGEGATVEHCIAPGITFQGQLMRKPLVTALTREERARREQQNPELPLTPAPATKEPEPQEQLPLV